MNDLHNKNGAKLCDAVGCRKHKKLISMYKGLFCAEHIDELIIIRNNIKNTYNTNVELKYREEELLFRKVVDKGHMQCVLNLYKNKNKVLLSKMNKIVQKRENELQNKNKEIDNKTIKLQNATVELLSKDHTLYLLNNKIKECEDTKNELRIYKIYNTLFSVFCLCFWLYYYITKYYL